MASTEQHIVVAPARYVVIRLASTITGLSEKAIQRKIERGDWIVNRQYRKGPDGRTYVDMKGVESWLTGKG